VVAIKIDLRPDLNQRHPSWRVLRSYENNHTSALLYFSPHGLMIPTDVFPQTPTTPQRDSFCICCSITSDALNKFFNPDHSSETKLSSTESPRETIVSLQTNSFDVNGLHPYHEGDYPAGAMLASGSIDNYCNDDQDLYSKSQVRKRLTSFLPSWKI
jgi:hypothetical protein